MSHDVKKEFMDPFFNALALRKLDQCETILSRLQALIAQEPALAHWYAYFAGVLANERDHDWGAAERIFEELLAADLEPALRSRVLLALGRTYGYQGRWADAIMAYEQTLPIFAALNQPMDQVKSWKQMAIAYCKGFMQGDFGPWVLQQAIDYCTAALDVLAATETDEPDVAWLEGSVWNTLGTLHSYLNQWDQAVACYEKDLAIARRLDDQHGMGITYLNLGEIHHRQGPDGWPQALQFFQEALERFRAFNNRYQEADVLANLAHLHQEMGDIPAALDFYAQAIERIEGLRANITSEEARAGFFATTVDTFANAILLCVAIGDHAQAFDIMERARARAFLDVLVAGSPDLVPAMEAETLSLARIQSALPDDAILVEYFTTGLMDLQADQQPAGLQAQRHRFPPAKTLIFVVTRDDLQVVDAGLSPNDLRPRQLDNVVARHFLSPQIRQALYERLIAPIADALQDKRRLYLIPHGPLHYIPFQALVAPDGEPLLRSGGPQIIYAPSASLLFRETRSEYSADLAPCLAVGYNGDGTTQLRYAEEEAQNIAQVTGGTAITGADPKKQRLFQAAEAYRLLHFSCHGIFDPQSPLESALYLAPDEYLMATEVIQHLQLRCDLVTLSACESGLSRVRRGDELIGLLRAFMFAGAPALVATLWQVDERSTRILMERFYQEIQAGTGFAEALQRAQLYLKGLTAAEAMACLQTATNSPTPTEEMGAGQDPIFADPYYWAPFILVGDPELGAE